jgi:lysophospholipid acyltransferase (LPLAT)-like uncharacterized protein
MARYLGYQDFSVSDNPKDKQTVKGTLQFIKYLKQGHDGVIALDGPNGPLHVAKPGIFHVAEKTNTLIIPIGVWYKNKIFFKNRWDKYQFPLPFTKCIISIGDPFLISGNLSDAIIAENMLRLSKKIDLENIKAGVDVLNF